MRRAIDGNHNHIIAVLGSLHGGLMAGFGGFFCHTTWSGNFPEGNRSNMQQRSRQNLLQLSALSDAQLAEWFRPVVVLHSKETYLPCDFLDYIDHCTLKDRETTRVVEEKVTSEKLACYNQDPADRALCLDCDPAFWTQQPNDLNEVPLYVKVDSSDPELYWLQYWMFYPYNGALDVGCFNRAACCPSNKAIIKAGAHQSDFEHISIYVDKRTQKMTRLYFSAHGNADGQWVDADKVQLYQNKQPIVYSAYHSHAHYVEPGCVPRVFGCANDFTEDQDTGRIWASSNLQLINENFPAWQGYVGGLGFPDSGDVPRNKEAWVAEPSQSATLWSRLFRYLNLSCCCQPTTDADDPPVPRPARFTAVR